MTEVRFSQSITDNYRSIGDKEFEFLAGTSNNLLPDGIDECDVAQGAEALDASENAREIEKDCPIKWRKRPSKVMLSRTSSDSQVNASGRSLKNSRRSRNRFGRGLPKKGGAGGKGTWGKLGSELLDEESVETGAMDPNDPNYDDLNVNSKTVKIKPSNSNDNFSNETMPAKNAVKHVKDEEICHALHTLLLEYYGHGDTEDAFLSMEELPWQDDQHSLLVIAAVEAAMDHKPSHCEMTSVLLADLYHFTLREEHYAAGYDKLLKNLDDLVIDTPTAPTILGNFIARSIADDCIPPKFLDSYKGQVESEHSAMCLDRAQSLLMRRHGLVRLDTVWGAGGGTRPVKLLVKKMTLLLKEYLSSSDVREAQRCLVELEVPHFHHELVYEAIVIALERLDDTSVSLIIKLLAALHASVVVTPNQMKEGFLRVFEDLQQISLDVPPAPLVLQKIITKCLEEKIITQNTARQMPTRARKRFVSEGDGGRFKDDFYY